MQYYKIIDINMSSLNRVKQAISNYLKKSRYSFFKLLTLAH